MKKNSAHKTFCVKFKINSGRIKKYDCLHTDEIPHYNIVNILEYLNRDIYSPSVRLFALYTGCTVFYRFSPNPMRRFPIGF